MTLIIGTPFSRLGSRLCMSNCLYIMAKVYHMISPEGIYIWSSCRKYLTYSCMGAVGEKVKQRAACRARSRKQGLQQQCDGFSHTPRAACGKERQPATAASSQWLRTIVFVLVSEPPNCVFSALSAIFEQYQKYLNQGIAVGSPPTTPSDYSHGRMRQLGWTPRVKLGHEKRMSSAWGLLMQAPKIGLETQTGDNPPAKLFTGFKLHAKNGAGMKSLKLSMR